MTARLVARGDIVGERLPFGMIVDGGGDAPCLDLRREIVHPERENIQKAAQQIDMRTAATRLRPRAIRRGGSGRHRHLRRLFRRRNGLGGRGSEQDRKHCHGSRGGDQAQFHHRHRPPMLGVTERTQNQSREATQTGRATLTLAGIPDASLAVDQKSKLARCCRDATKVAAKQGNSRAGTVKETRQKRQFRSTGRGMPWLRLPRARSGRQGARWPRRPCAERSPRRPECRG